MQGQTRCSAAIVQDRKILLVEHHFFGDGGRYWILPGGRQEPGETDNETVSREAQEETGLIVRVERSLLEESSARGGKYNCYKTYLCTPMEGTAQPGYEPEA